MSKQIRTLAFCTFLTVGVACAASVAQAASADTTAQVESTRVSQRVVVEQALQRSAERGFHRAPAMGSTDADSPSFLRAIQKAKSAGKSGLWFLLC
jgi:hypothetical protein